MGVNGCFLFLAVFWPKAHSTYDYRLSVSDNGDVDFYFILHFFLSSLFQQMRSRRKLCTDR